MQSKKTYIFVLMLCAVSAIAFGASQTEASAATTIKYIHGYPNVPSDVYYFQEVKKRLNIEIEAEGVEQLQTKLPTMFASKDLPDLLAVIRPIANEYGPQGALEPVNNYFDVAPNIERYYSIDVNPWVYFHDGNLYFYPYTPFPYTNWGWLRDGVKARELGLDMPVTLDDWVEDWKAVKADDPDAIPWISHKFQQAWAFISVCFGEGNANIGDFTFTDGVFTSPHIGPRVREAITWFNMAYEEGLLWNETGTSSNYAAVTENANKGLVYTTTTYMDLVYSVDKVTKDIYERWEPVPPPKGKYGSGNPWMGTTSYWGLAVPSTSSEKEAAFRVIDFMLSDEGKILGMWGEAGTHHTENPDGSREFVASIIDAAKAASQPTSVYCLENYGFGGNISPPGAALSVRESLEIDEALGLHPNYIKGKAIVATNLQSPLPPTWNTDEELARIGQLNGDLNTYAMEWLMKFITGKEPLSKWDQYEAKMVDLGIREVEKLVNDGYKRYLDAVGKPVGYVPDWESMIDVSGLAEKYDL